MIDEAIYLTGVGVASPLGNTVADVTRNLLGGVSGAARVASFPVDQHPSQIAAVVGDWPGSPALDPLQRLGQWCATEALRSAGVTLDGTRRVGLVLGVGSEWMLGWEYGSLPLEPTPARVPGLVTWLAETLGITGPTLTLSTACASGNHALLIARQWLRLGWVDVCLAGACDAAVTPLTLAAFGNLRALSRRNDAPTLASRPFDRDRDGFVLGEGGTVFALERASSAAARGADVLAELAGGGLTSDAYHAIIPDPQGTQAAAAMRAALNDAGIPAEAVDCINAHGTSTPVGDVAEAAAIRQALGSHGECVPVSSTKSMTGHLLTAAAAFEALACIIALREQTLPPTINLDAPDPACVLNHVANVARRAQVRTCLSNAFGFGGSNSAIVLRAA